MKISRVLICIILSSVFLLGACGSSKVDVTDYVTVDFKGTEKEGKAEYHLDEEKLVKDLFNIDKDVLEHSTLDAVTLTEIKDTEEAINIEFDKKEGLENGDTVTVTVDVDENLTDKIKDGKKKFKVEGLDGIIEPKIISSKELREIIQYNFEGTSGGTIWVRDADFYIESDGVRKEVDMGLSDAEETSEIAYDLKNGDVAKFKFTKRQISELKKIGYVLEDEDIVLETVVKGLD